MLRLKVLRDGCEREVSYQLQKKHPMVPVLHGVDCQPCYFIIAGRVAGGGGGGYKGAPWGLCIGPASRELGLECSALDCASLLAEGGSFCMCALLFI